MSKKNKLLKRLLSRPTDFTFNEAISLLSYYDYDLDQSYSGSRVRFKNKDLGTQIVFHKPHPQNVLKDYVLDIIITQLRKDGSIWIM